MSTHTAGRMSYTLPEVADLTGLSLRSLQEGVRAREVPHSRHRRQVVMTPEQITRFLANVEIAAEGGDSGEVDQIAEHRRKIARRYGWEAA